MAQGKSKLKGNAKKLVNQLKHTKPTKQMKAKTSRKGARAITPKNQKLKQDVNFRKGLEAAINKKIEVELKDRASKEGKPFQMLDSKKVQKQAAAAKKKNKKK